MFFLAFTRTGMVCLARSPPPLPNHLSNSLYLTAHIMLIANRRIVRTVSQDLCCSFQECGEVLGRHQDLFEYIKYGGNLAGLHDS